MFLLSSLSLTFISFINRANIWRSCLTNKESLWVHKSQITFWKKIVWWARSRVNAISISSISSPKALRTTNEVWNSRKFLQQGADPFSEAFGLQGPDAYAYTSMSNCLAVQGIDDVKDFHETLVR